MLKLIALDKNDLDVISAHIQDSIVQLVILIGFLMKIDF